MEGFVEGKFHGFSQPHMISFFHQCSKEVLYIKNICISLKNVVDEF
jgi:hypothetical protein